MTNKFTDYSSEQSLKIYLAFFVGFLQFYSLVFLTKYFDYSLVNEYSLVVFSVQQVLILFLNVFLQKKSLFRLEYFAALAILSIVILSKATFGWSASIVVAAFFSILLFLQLSVVKLFKDCGDKINYAYTAEMCGGFVGVLSWYYLSAKLGFYGFAVLSVLLYSLILTVISTNKKLALIFTLCFLSALFFLQEPNPVFNKRGNQKITASGKMLNKIWDPNGTVEFIETSNDLTFVLFEGGSLRSHINKFDGDFVKLRQDYQQGNSRMLWGLDVAAAHFLIDKDKYSTALISVIGGQEILAAKAFGATDIVAIDINKSAQQEVLQSFKDYTGDIYQNVQIANIDGRKFIQDSDKLYDVIQIYSAFNASYSSSLGLQFLQSSLMTVEALKDYKAKLNDNGILQVTQNGYYKNRSVFLKAFGEDLLSSKKIIIFKRADGHEGLVSFLYRKTAWSENELKKLEDWLASDKALKWQFLVHPYKGNNEPKLNPTEDLKYLEVASTDDRPFFKLVNAPISFIQIQALILISIIISIGYFFLQKTSRTSKKHTQLLFLMGATFAITQSLLIIKFQQYLGNPAKGLSFALASLFVVLAAAWFGRKLSYSNKFLTYLSLTLSVVLILGAFANVTPGPSLLLILVMLGLSFLQSCLFQKILFELRQDVVWLLLLNGLGFTLGITLFHLVYIHLGLAAVFTLSAILYALLNLIKPTYDTSA